MMWFDIYLCPRKNAIDVFFSRYIAVGKLEFMMSMYESNMCISIVYR